MISTFRPSFSAAQLLVRASVPLSCGFAVFVGWALVHHKTRVEIVAALLTTLPLLLSPRARIAFIIFGGLIVFHSSTTLTPLKLYFFFGVTMSVAGAFVRLRGMSNPVRRDLRPLFATSRAFGVLIMVSLLVSIAYGTPHKEWLRDATPYLLFAAAPLIAVDAESALSQGALRRLLVIAGLLGSAAFAAKWLSARQIVNVSAFGLPTFFLGAALFSYAMAAVLEGDRQRLRWLLLAATILVGLVATGTRSSVILLAAPIAIVLGARRHFARRSIRFALAIPAAALLVLLGVQSFLKLTGAHRDVIQSRIQLVSHTGTSSDQSYKDRLAQTSAAWTAFKRSPVFGLGPGYPISWETPTGLVETSAAIDSPVEYLMKFGVLGLWPLVVLVWSFGRTIRLLRQRTVEPTIAQLALLGLAGAFLAWWVLGVPFDDKGLASGFILLLALALSETSVVRPAR